MKKSIIILIVISMLLTSINCFAADGYINASIDALNKKVNIVGCTNEKTCNSVVIRITKPNGGIDINAVTSDSEGIFSWNFVLRDDIEGVYKVDAAITGKDQLLKSSFVYKKGDTIPPNPAQPTKSKSKSKGGGGVVMFNSITPTPSKEVVDIEEKDVPKSVSTAMTDIKGHWAEKYVLKLMDKGIIKGYPDNLFKPDLSINRAEMSVIIVNALGLKPLENPDLSFFDKEEIPDWAKGYIQAIVEKGIIKGYEDNTFRAFNTLTRQELAVIIIKALDYKDVKESSTKFVDDSNISSWAKAYVSKAAELKLVNGFEDNTFGPEKKTTRAEVSVIVSKAMEIK